jgi:methanogenic corrinoid protein MtbC1
MAALVVATARCRVVYLGTDTPLAEIVAFAREAEARAIAISVSLATKGCETDAMLVDLRDQTPRRVSLIVGGDGAPAPSAGIQTISTLAELFNWAERLHGA